MRITNSMMLNTNKSNINSNKIAMDILSTQLATQKKIQKPSDDPIVAIRSLRLRKSVSEMEQFNDKNIKDAESWLDITESSIKNMSEILQNMYYDFTKGASGEHGVTERKAILEDLDALCAQYFSEGNSTYAGRTIFTGYKTDMNFTYLDGAPDASYQINEKFTVGDIQSEQYVSQKVTDLTNFRNILAGDTPQINDIFVYSLSYTGVDFGNLPDTPNVTPEITYTDATGAEQKIAVTEKSVSADGDSAYAPKDDEVYFIKETSELVFGKDINNTLSSLGDKAELSITYNKKGFNVGDVNPVFYYDCKDLNTGVEYTKEDQPMEYQVTANQYLKVNTQADEVIYLDVEKDIRRLRNSLSEVEAVETKVKQLEEMLESPIYDTTEKENIQSMLDATKKELDLSQSILQDLFEHGIDDFQEYQNEVNVQRTDLGNRDSRLLMIKERTSQQLTTFNELLTNNEDVNLSDIILNNTAAQYAYQLSLQAVGSISGLSLLNYI